MPLVKTWEREFAVERMRDHPEISYRSFARVLGVSHATISRWAAEAGLPPRETNAERRRRRERALAGRARRLPRSRPVPDEEIEEEFENEEGHELPEATDGSPGELGDVEDENEQDEEEYEYEGEDESPPTPYLAQAFEALASWQTAKTAGAQPSPKAVQRAQKAEPRPPRSIPAPVPRADPRTRLGAITAELDARRPRGRVAVNLLVEAALYLRGGVAALRSYGEARGCDPSDVDTAERVIAGRHAGRVS